MTKGGKKTYKPSPTPKIHSHWIIKHIFPRVTSTACTARPCHQLIEADHVLMIIDTDGLKMAHLPTAKLVQPHCWPCNTAWIQVIRSKTWMNEETITKALAKALTPQPQVSQSNRPTQLSPHQSIYKRGSIPESRLGKVFST